MLDVLFGRTSERRQTVRRRVSAEVYLNRAYGSFARYQAVNISSGGAFLQPAPEGVSSGAKVEMAFAFRSDRIIWIYRLQGIVVHVGDRGVGLKFATRRRGTLYRSSASPI